MTANPILLQKKCARVVETSAQNAGLTLDAALGVSGLKLPKRELDGVLRISFSYDTTPQDVAALAEGLAAAQSQLFPSLS